MNSFFIDNSIVIYWKNFNELNSILRWTIPRNKKKNISAFLLATSVALFGSLPGFLEIKTQTAWRSFSRHYGKVLLARVGGWILANALTLIWNIFFCPILITAETKLLILQNKNHQKQTKSAIHPLTLASYTHPLGQSLNGRAWVFWEISSCRESWWVVGRSFMSGPLFLIGNFLGFNDAN